MEEAPPENKENKGVTLPAENEADTGYTQSNGDAPPTPEQRRLMGSVMVDDSRITQSQHGSSGQKRQALRQRQTTQMFLVMVIFYRVLTLLMALYPA